MTDPSTLAAIAATFVLAGMVKGVIGLGLPTIALAVLTALIGLTEAMALMIVPSFATNLWQATAGGNGRVLVQRLWPFLMASTLAVWFGALALTRVDLALLAAFLGVIVVIYAALGLTRPNFTLAPRHEPWLGPVLGVVNGIFTGMTGSFVMPGVPYLQALGLPRDMLIQAMGMLFCTLTLALAVALGGNELITLELGGLSAVGLVPALLGMALGQRLRRRLSEALFRRLFFLSLLVLGAYIVVQALMR